jgi:hypothetical protein
MLNTLNKTNNIHDNDEDVIFMKNFYHDQINEFLILLISMQLTNNKFYSNY